VTELPTVHVAGAATAAAGETARELLATPDRALVVRVGNPPAGAQLSIENGTGAALEGAGTVSRLEPGETAHRVELSAGGTVVGLQVASATRFVTLVVTADAAAGGAVAFVGQLIAGQAG
jgi:hypothetical protein